MKFRNKVHEESLMNEKRKKRTKKEEINHAHGLIS